MALILSNDQLFSNLLTILKAPGSGSPFFDLSALPVWWCPWIHDIGEHICWLSVIEFIPSLLFILLEIIVQTIFLISLLASFLNIISHSHSHSCSCSHSLHHCVSLPLPLFLLGLTPIFDRPVYRLLEARIPRSSQYHSRLLSPLQPERPRSAHSEGVSVRMYGHAASSIGWAERQRKCRWGCWGVKYSRGLFLL